MDTQSLNEHHLHSIRSSSSTEIEVFRIFDMSKKNVFVIDSLGRLGLKPSPNIVNSTTSSSVVYGPDREMVMLESPALNQLVNYAYTHHNDTTAYAQTASGIVYPTLTGSLRVGPRGPVLLQDAFLIEKLQLFNRERIPERVVHSKGGG